MAIKKGTGVPSEGVLAELWLLVAADHAEGRET